MLKLEISVPDCICCPGYLSVGGEYKQKTSGYLTGLANSSSFATTANYFTATGKDVCFFKTDGNGGSETRNWSTSKQNCENGNYVDAEYRSMGGWRLPTLAELGKVHSVHSKLSSQVTSAPGTVDLIKQRYWSSSESSSTNAWYWGYFGIMSFRGPKSSVGGTYTRCVKSF